MTKIIRVSYTFAVLCCDWLKNWRHFLNQSEFKPQQIVIWFAYSRFPAFDAGYTYLLQVLIGSPRLRRIINCFIIQHIDSEVQFNCRKAGDDHFSPRNTKLRVSEDICCLRTTNIQCTMTIFEQCHNVSNNKMEHLNEI